ncbi:MAG: type II toxin-antitoxin system RelE/ParE family toxin [Chloroflexi bacterium]|nr:type II toxin-antitoxin system RelE/ParE family toxin [Chloroflexota bacterium]
MRLKFTPTAEGDLARLDKPIASLVYKRLVWLAENIDSIVPIPLKGDLNEYNKFRVGDYRALYTIDKSRQELIVHFVHFVRHRREVYREK